MIVWSWDPVLRFQQKTLCQVLELFRLINIFLWLIYIWTSLLFHVVCIHFSRVPVPVCIVAHRIVSHRIASHHIVAHLPVQVLRRIGTKSENSEVKFC
jgi:hypothetical protein